MYYSKMPILSQINTLVWPLESTAQMYVCVREIRLLILYTLVLHVFDAYRPPFLCLKRPM